jgi:hypothetical protein
MVEQPVEVHEGEWIDRVDLGPEDRWPADAGERGMAAPLARQQRQLADEADVGEREATRHDIEACRRECAVDAGHVTSERIRGPIMDVGRYRVLPRR